MQPSTSKGLGWLSWDIQPKLFSNYGRGVVHCGEAVRLGQPASSMKQNPTVFSPWEYVNNGILSKEQQETILSCLEDGEDFIPQLVGMPERRFEEWDEEEDHSFFEMNADSFETTTECCDISSTPQELVDQFLARKNHWNPDECNYEV